MDSSSSSHWADRATLLPARQDLHLRLHSVTIFVRDQDRSLRFYLDQLGFSLVMDARSGSGERWVAVAPPNGPTILELCAPKPGSEDYTLIGRTGQVVFVTEDVTAKFDELCKRGVHFHHPPEAQLWGTVFTTFEDVDGNSFKLVGLDAMSRLENHLLREIEAEARRREAQELEIAKQVQGRLFPQTLPPLRTLDYAGTCIQARQVGGDYYDFLDLGQERLGLVIGDISGKGIAAALLMANLQANVRSQCAIALDQPQRLLRSVNRLFYENTTDSAYATLFFAEYDDRARRLRYANCGHLSAVLLRSDNTLERLDSTCTVLGLLGEWECSMEERRLFCGDTLALYTDGISESFNDAGEEIGEERLIESLQRHPDLSPQALLASIIDDVQQFSPHGQHDDITLIVARCREN